MSLSAYNYQPNKQYTFTAIVNQVGMEKELHTQTRMLFDVQVGEETEEHSWIKYPEDASQFARFSFGDKVTFKATVAPYPDGSKRVGIVRVSGVMKVGRADEDTMEYMCKVKDTYEYKRNGIRQFFGFSKYGDELTFESAKARDEHMEEVFG